MYKSSVNFPVVMRIIGMLLMIESAFMLIPLFTALVYDEPDWVDFGVAAGAALVVGGLMVLLIRPGRNRDMNKRDGFLLTALVWIVFSLFGMIPFLMNEALMLNVSEAFFETMSGFTTTGASILMDVESLSRSMLMWRSEMNWIGGMGIILFTLAIIPMLNHSGGMQMFDAEVTGITHEKLRPRISSTAKRMWGIYLLLTVVLVLLLWAGPMGFFDSVCHALSTISTGGFSTRNNSVGDWNSAYIDIVITVFMFLGGVNFALIFKAMHGQFRQVAGNDVFKLFLKTILFFYILFVITIFWRGQYTGIKSVTIDPLFIILSTITSTGFTVVDFEVWGYFTLSMLFFMMFFGACAGSTSGGAKLDRMLFLSKNLSNEIHRTIHPNSIFAVRVNGKVMSMELVNKVIAFLCLYVLIIAVGGAMLTAMGLPLVDAFFSAFSCIGNTGLGAGITGYGGGYDLVPDAGKWVLSLIMLTGRLEVFTILILCTRSFWRR